MKKLLLGLLIVSQLDAALANSKNWRNRTETCHHCNGAGTINYTVNHNSAIFDLFGGSRFSDPSFDKNSVEYKAHGSHIAPTHGIESWTISFSYIKSVYGADGIAKIYYEDTAITVAQLRDYFYRGDYDPDFIELPSSSYTISFKDRNGNYYDTATLTGELDSFLRKRMCKQESKTVFQLLLSKIGL